MSICYIVHCLNLKSSGMEEMCKGKEEVIAAKEEEIAGRAQPGNFSSAADA